MVPFQNIMNKKECLVDSKIHEYTDSSVLGVLKTIFVSTLDLQHIGKTMHWDLCSHSKYIWFILLFTIWNSSLLNICLMWMVELNTGFQLKATELKTLWGIYNAHCSWALNFNSEHPGNQSKMEPTLWYIVLNTYCSKILTHPFNSSRQIIYFLIPL